jgi:hypothetical protein
MNKYPNSRVVSRSCGRCYGLIAAPLYSSVNQVHHVRCSLHLINKLEGLLKHSVEMLKLMALNIHVQAMWLPLHTAELKRYTHS